MSSANNNPTPIPDSKTQKGSSSKTQKKISSSSSSSTNQLEQHQPLKCPRCDSSNTKFCYYNNYSLRQPRHFCKTCRRYWTHGGSLRNVPIGGASRKPKTTNVGPGFSYHQVNPANPFGVPTVERNQLRVSLSSDIESLSSINQEMHWKLQQQRLVSLISCHQPDNHHSMLLQKPPPAAEAAAAGPVDWMFDQTTSSYYTYVPHNSGAMAASGCNSSDAEGAAASGWNYLHHHQFNGLH